MVQIIKVINYTIPMYGNKRCLPYGDLLITDGIITKQVKIKDDEWSQYFTFNRKRYYITNTGGLYSPRFEIKEEQTK